MNFPEFENSECAFCAKKDSSELIDMSANSLMLYDEVVEFNDLISSLFDCKFQDDQATFTCEECKNMLIQCHVFKQNTRNSKLFAVDQNIERVKMFLDDSDEELCVMRYNKCLSLVPQSKRSFMEIFKLWQPSVILETLETLPNPPKRMKSENVNAGIGTEVPSDEYQRLAKILKVETIETSDECLEGKSVEEMREDEEWIQMEICNSEIIETDEGVIESWVCTHCNPHERFFEVKEFRAHLTSHEDFSQVLVDPQSVEYEEIEELQKDNQEKEAEQFECIQCDFFTNDQNKLRVHLKTHFDQKIFQSAKYERLFCGDCSYQFVTQAHFQAHVNGHQLYAIVARHSNFPVCEICNMMFSDESFASSHQERHDRGEPILHPEPSEGLFLKFGHHRPELEPVNRLKHERTVKCGHCTKIFLDEESCRIHQLIFHVITLKCPIESRVFKGNQAFSIHMRNNHPDLFGDDVKFSCSVCKQEFDNLYEKLGHMKTCDQKRFQCNHCEKKFSQKCYLMTHLRQVSGQTSIICEVCQKVCRDKGDYQIHHRSHSNIKPFLCSMCPKAYKTSSARAAHIETHMDKGFNCEFCSLRFKSRRTLQKHTKTKHSESVDKLTGKVSEEEVEIF